MLSVKQVYDKIAQHFDVSRQRVWGSVKQFLNSLPINSYVLDLGCGNGKNMLYRNDLNIIGIDISSELIKICQKKQLNVTEANITALPFETNTFDNMLCIATYHHLDNSTDREKALNEFYRCLKPGGTLLLTVWSITQPEGSPFKFKQGDEIVPWKTPDGKTYMRYYHIYDDTELEKEVDSLCPKFKIAQKGWELGNWYIVLEK
jgi:ubiquinone/menaquinone biosynthesis C-methylase UbiE